MEQTLFTAFAQSGWAGLSLVLIAWLLKRNDEREARLMAFIEKEMREIREDVRAIKDFIIEERVQERAAQERRK